MVRPDHFCYNPETAATNSFMKTPEQLGIHEEDVPIKSMVEFHRMAHVLEERGITVYIFRSPPKTPDAVFPNNWLSVHDDSTLVLYPMCSPSRRRERQVGKLLECLTVVHPKGTKVISLSYEERRKRYLEGTGSMVLDRVAKTAFAIGSPRTDLGLFQKWCEIMKHKPVMFNAFDRIGEPIYHTNVVMSIGDRFAVVCFDAISTSADQLLVESTLSYLKKELIPITMDQMHSFCGNILQLSDDQGKAYIVLSQTAFDAFTDDQRQTLSTFGALLPVAIPVIEGIGGGSARCMIAEIF